MVALSFFPGHLSSFIQGLSARHILSYALILTGAVLAAVAANQSDPNDNHNALIGAILTFGGQVILTAITALEDWFFEDSAPPAVLVVGYEGPVSSILSAAMLLIVTKTGGFDGSGLHENVSDTLKRLGGAPLLIAALGLAAAVVGREATRPTEPDRGHAVGAVLQIAIVWAVQLVLGKAEGAQGLGEEVSKWSLLELAALLLAGAAVLVQGEVIRVGKAGSWRHPENVNQAPLVSE